MDAKSQRIVELVNAVVGPVLGGYVKELRLLRKKVDELERQLAHVKIMQGSHVRKVRMSND